MEKRRKKVTVVDWIEGKETLEKKRNNIERQMK